MKNIIVSENGFNNSDPYAIIQSNITVVNLLLEEGYDPELIKKEAFISYYVDYYLAQVNNGGFAQFVYNSSWNEEIVLLIEEGLESMKATLHLAYFRNRAKFVSSLAEEVIDAFLETDLFGENKLRDQMNDDSFYTIKEDLIALNSSWLKKQPDLLVLSIDNMFVELEKILGKEISKN
ncbi:DUF4375 domain-containing protein [Flavobacterium sp. '19STA2R22 D10 B1']|uniref:DMP19 family protein n=1 Tax=Flavobacterium aerium TaxID=3037261 RepID=UPI00278BB6A7|nr:DUF4375 domain-containing protein [Flavobacterium sp. '19STA2R22 D10 B1']